MTTSPPHLHAAALRALELIADDSVVGLGSGRAATAFIEALGARVRAGLRVRGVATSQASADLAQRLSIPLTTPDEIEAIDIAVDGADEVDPHGNLIKGYGGALVREKIVAASARRLVILVGPDKLVPVLGARGKLPVEVIPFGLPWCARQLAALGLKPKLRMREGHPYFTDNGNQVLDCGIAPLEQPAQLEQQITAIAGVVGTGLFLQMADTVLIAHEQEVEVRERLRS